MVMKKTGNKHLFRTIKKNAVSFFAVAFIAAVSIAIFIGLQSAATAIMKGSGKYYVTNNLATMEIACANGITKEDLAAVASWEGVDVAEGGYSSMVTMATEYEKITLQAMSMTEEMNDIVVLEGTLPTAANEIAVEELFVMRKGIQVGDVVTLVHDGELVEDTFTVTAIINQPAFCCARIHDSRGKATEGLGAAAYYIAMTKDAFDASYYDDCYTKLSIRSEELGSLYYYSEEYKALEAEMIARLEDLGAERAELRYQEIDREVQTEIADAEAELGDAEADIKKAEADIADAKKKIADAEQEIEDGKSDLVEAKTEYADAEKEIADAKLALADASEELEAQLKSMKLSTDLDKALTQLKAFGPAGQPLVTAIKEYQVSEDSLADAEKELADAKLEIIDGEKELADGEKELAEKKAELADGEADLAEAMVEFTDAQAELEEAKLDVQDLKLQKWQVSGRNDIGDVRAVRIIADGIFNISYSMSIIFLFVAIIVCHAAISRMIDEQRVLIGAQKALGFQFGEVLRHYMSYNFLSGLLGIAIGCFLGYAVVENLVLFVFAHEFVMGKIPLAFAWKEAVLAAVLCMMVFLGSTYFACAKLIRRPATELLRGEVPERSKGYFFEHWKPYKKLNLYSRTMIKNVLNDKARMMTTVMGVVGCISLLLICFSLKMGIENSSVVHFDKYFLYDYRLVVDSSVGEPAEFEAALDKEGIDYTVVHDKMKFFRNGDDEWESGRIIAVSDFEELKNFIYLEDVSTKDYAAVPTDGVLVSRKCAEMYDFAVGDSVEIMDDEGNSLYVTISAIMEHYLPYHLFVTSAEYYETALEEATDNNIFLLKGDLDIDALRDKLKDMDGYFSLKDNTEFAANADAHTGVIAVCFVLSAVMAVLVLLNQITMHINRKAKELAVMRINGYTLKETKAYIYKDNIVLTTLGLILGSGFGMILSYIIITSVETGANRYVRTPNVVACVVSIAVGALFALLVNIYALRKVNHLNLTNVNGN